MGRARFWVRFASQSETRWRRAAPAVCWPACSPRSRDPPPRSHRGFITWAAPVSLTGAGAFLDESELLRSPEAGRRPRRRHACRHGRWRSRPRTCPGRRRRSSSHVGRRPDRSEAAKAKGAALAACSPWAPAVVVAAVTATAAVTAIAVIPNVIGRIRITRPFARSWAGRGRRAGCRSGPRCRRAGSWGAMMPAGRPLESARAAVDDPGRGPCGQGRAEGSASPRRGYGSAARARCLKLIVPTSSKWVAPVKVSRHSEMSLVPIAEPSRPGDLLVDRGDERGAR